MSDGSFANPGLEEAAAALTKGHPEPYATLRRDALAILDAALAAVQPDRLLAGVLAEDGTLTLPDQTVLLGRGEGLHVLVVGKGSAGFARIASERLPEAQGLVIGEGAGKAGAWTWLTGNHPVPEKDSAAAGEAALDFVQAVGPDETLLVLLSGGASALMEVPEVPLEDLALTNATLLARGVTIHEMNTVRRHLSRIKGGQLAAACPGRVLTLAISDVPKNDPATLGSGPTVPDPTTFGQALAVIERIGIENFPPVVVEHIRRGSQGKVPETPKPGGDLDNAEFYLLATNETAQEASEERARALGYRPTVLPSPLEGEARVMGESLGRRLASEGGALLAGGETVVTLKPDHKGGPGLGGRNQELTLAAALHIAGAPAVVCGFGTDGVDGPTDAAGAIADGRSLARGAEKKRDARAHVQANDAYTFFAALGDLVKTGPTGTNVMDLFVGLTAQD